MTEVEDFEQGFVSETASQSDPDQEQDLPQESQPKHKGEKGKVVSEDKEEEAEVWLGEPDLKEAMKEIAAIKSVQQDLKRQIGSELLRHNDRKTTAGLRAELKKKEARLSDLREAVHFLEDSRDGGITVVMSSSDEEKLAGDKDVVSPIQSRLSDTPPPELNQMEIMRQMAQNQQEAMERMTRLFALTLQASTNNTIERSSSAASGESSDFPSNSSGSSDRRRKKVKEVPKLKVSSVEQPMQVVRFIYNFEITMESHRVPERDQKEFLMESVHPEILSHLMEVGIDASSIRELLDEVQKRLLGSDWFAKVLKEWEELKMGEKEKVFSFRRRVFMFTRALGRDPLEKELD